MTEADDDTRNRRLEKLRFWRRACADQGAKWKCYNDNGADIPLIFFHGDTDMGGLYVRRLAAECGYPIAALAPRSIEEPGLRPCVEALGKDMVEDILAFRPSGPYRLGGYCNGAIIAYECARRLMERGHEVEVVVMIEPASLNTRPVFRAVQQLIAAMLPPPEARSLKTQQRFGDVMHVVWNIGRLLHLSPRELLGLVRYLGHRRMMWRGHLVAGEQEALDQERQVRETDAAFKTFHWRSVSTYLPLPTQIPIVALSTGMDGGGRRCGMYDGVQWARVAANFRHIRLRGHHATCLSTHVGELASDLKSILRGLPPGKTEPPAQRLARQQGDFTILALGKAPGS